MLLRTAAISGREARFCRSERTAAQPLTFRYLNSDCNTLIGTTTSNPPPNSAFPRGPIGTTTCDQVNNFGEVWTVALWEVRASLIDALGPAEGNRRALQYITDGMKLSPLNPTVLQMRDAILVAAQAANPSDVRHVWRGFAMRGMGFWPRSRTSVRVITTPS
ncbi:MAG: M36 family metallopeptidase [Chloracidobacterium sp.]|nr:M36 family metallopeptidase [Chloracidobacterium sp.]